MKVKVCRKCSVGKAVNAFDNDKTREDGKYPWCKACRTAYNKALRKSFITDDLSKLCEWCEGGIGGTHSNRKFCSDSCKNKARKVQSYGLTVSEYNLVMDFLEGRCPVCQRKVRKWNIDHNHVTGETYSPVCVTCNTAVLAFSYHDLEIAKRLVDFYENPPVRRLLGGPRFVTSRREYQNNLAKKHNGPTPGVWSIKSKKKGL